MGTQPIHHITNLQTTCLANFRTWLPFDHNNIGHGHQQNSTAPEQIYPACLRLPKYISIKLLHDSSGLPYVKDKLLSCATRTLERISRRGVNNIQQGQPCVRSFSSTALCNQSGQSLDYYDLQG